MDFNGLTLNEYLLIIEPEASVKQQIQRFKRYFIQSYRFSNAIVTRTHLTLMRCLQYESYESRFVQKLRNISATVSPFDIELQGFGNFGHTLYIDVKTIHPILDVVSNRKEEIKPFVNRNMKQAPFFVKKPHITIARQLTPTQCNMVWALWSRAKYEGRFHAKKMLLLKRRVGTRTYRKVEKFTFRGQIPYPIQGRLFN
ncbi:2'-5' RNA ligase family protein [Parapedobacter tibetensis]|uniref:2'-5' RNA ligase family protein n=1 Tax=Parapedobacter tibetensis TaxID=2972951 RepID=UPI00214D89F7|nr:2'-5' RNA ligase family protein [Parapedobacter tibetensis]